MRLQLFILIDAQPFFLYFIVTSGWALLAVIWISAQFLHLSSA
jgi:hypothetical protein